MKGRRFGGGFPPKPVKVGDVVDLKIEGHGKSGDGVGKINGYVIFVKGETTEGETYKVEIKTVGRRFATGEIVQ